MANSLRAKLSKLRHDGNITDVEYQELIKKLDGHDRELIAKTIDDLSNTLKEELNKYDFWHYDIISECYVEERNVSRDWMIDEIVDQMKNIKE